MDSFKEIACGSIAGISGKFIEHPFDTVKVRLQTQAALVADGASIPFSGPIDCFKQTWRKEGLLGLYQGLPSPMVGAMMENAVMFMAFSRISNLLKQALETQTLTLPQTCLVGALSGTCASVVLTPAELIKCR
eukprot:Partr_v1_DN27495_c2_g1_i2_m71665 putative solute carrier family 25 (mitochondrial carrier)